MSDSEEERRKSTRRRAQTLISKKKQPKSDDAADVDWGVDGTEDTSKSPERPRELVDSLVAFKQGLATMKGSESGQTSPRLGFPQQTLSARSGSPRSARRRDKWDLLASTPRSERSVDDVVDCLKDLDERDASLENNVHRLIKNQERLVDMVEAMRHLVESSSPLVTGPKPTVEELQRQNSALRDEINRLRQELGDYREEAGMPPESTTADVSHLHTPITPREIEVTTPEVSEAVRRVELLDAAPPTAETTASKAHLEVPTVEEVKGFKAEAASIERPESSAQSSAADSESETESPRVVEQKPEPEPVPAPAPEPVQEAKAPEPEPTPELKPNPEETKPEPAQETKPEPEPETKAAPEAAPAPTPVEPEVQKVQEVPPQQEKVDQAPPAPVAPVAPVPVAVAPVVDTYNGPPKLTVTVIRATNVMAADGVLAGDSDPYVELVIGNKKYKTSVKDECKNPVWDQTFVFDGIKGTEVMSVNCWDKDVIGSDDLGANKIQLAEVQQGETAVTLKLKGQGELFLRLLAQGFGRPAARELPPPAEAPKVEAPNAEEPKAAEPKVEEPKAEEAKAEETKTREIEVAAPAPEPTPTAAPEAESTAREVEPVADVAQKEAVVAAPASPRSVPPPPPPPPPPFVRPAVPRIDLNEVHNAAEERNQRQESGRQHAEALRGQVHGELKDKAEEQQTRLQSKAVHKDHMAEVASEMNSELEKRESARGQKEAQAANMKTVLEQVAEAAAVKAEGRAAAAIPVVASEHVELHSELKEKVEKQKVKKGEEQVKAKFPDLAAELQRNVADVEERKQQRADLSRALAEEISEAASKRTPRPEVPADVASPERTQLHSELKKHVEAGQTQKAKDEHQNQMAQMRNELLDEVAQKQARDQEKRDRETAMKNVQSELVNKVTTTPREQHQAQAPTDQQRELHKQLRDAADERVTRQAQQTQRSFMADITSELAEVVADREDLAQERERARATLPQLHTELLARTTDGGSLSPRDSARKQDLIAENDELRARAQTLRANQAVYEERTAELHTLLSNVLMDKAKLEGTLETQTRDCEQHMREIREYQEKERELRLRIAALEKKVQAYAEREEHKNSEIAQLRKRLGELEPEGAALRAEVDAAQQEREAS